LFLNAHTVECITLRGDAVLKTGKILKSWCDTCKAVREQEVISDGETVTVLKCKTCGCENHLIQGINANLM